MLHQKSQCGGGVSMLCFLIYQKQLISENESGCSTFDRPTFKLTFVFKELLTLQFKKVLVFSWYRWYIICHI